MNHNKLFRNKYKDCRIHFTDEQAVSKLTDKILHWFPRLPREYVALCIGTDRSTGDSLGPLTGSFLKNKKPKHINVYGTLHYPVHAANLIKYINQIKLHHRNPFIIAIDACLGKSASIGQLIAGTGPLQPGAALNKPLPPIGDIHITGVVNTGGFMEHSTLQSTRLSLVMDMAQTTAELLNSLDQELNPSYLHRAAVRRRMENMEGMQSAEY